MKHKKLLLGVMLFGWSLITIIILTFAAPISNKIQKKIISEIRKKRNIEITKLEDVKVNLEEVYLSNKSYFIKYDVYPSDVEELDLEFIALDKNINVSKTDKNGFILIEATDKTSMFYTSSFQIISKNHDFKKVFNVNFCRKYPSGIQFNFIDKFNNKTSKLITNVGIPFFTTYNILGESSENNVDIEFDELYIKKIGNNEFIPLKNGKTSLTATTANGISSTINVEIFEKVNDVECINDIKFINVDNKDEISSEDEFIVGSTFGIELYQNGQKVNTNYNIEVDNYEKISLDRYDQIKILTPGISKIKITLPNGYEYTKEIKAINHLELPTIVEPKLNENNVLTILNGKDINFTFCFPNSATYCKYKLNYDNSMFHIVLDDESNVARIIPKKVGSTSITIKIDDGYDQLIGNYDIVILENPHDLRNEKNIVSVLVNKFGHLILFAIEAIISIFFFQCFNVKKFDLRCLLFSLIHLIIGLILAGITEYIQTFIPNRIGCIKDAIIDMIFYITTSLIVLIIFAILKLIKQKKGVVHGYN